MSGRVDTSCRGRRCASRVAKYRDMLLVTTRLHVVKYIFNVALRTYTCTHEIPKKDKYKPRLTQNRSFSTGMRHTACDTSAPKHNQRIHNLTVPITHYSFECITSIDLMLGNQHKMQPNDSVVTNNDHSIQCRGECVKRQELN